MLDYEEAQNIYWQGRQSKPNLSREYWYQDIALGTIDGLKNKLKNKEKLDIALIGYACDEGVDRNFGRIGAKQGPKILRERLAKLPIHYNSKQVTDFGNIICINKNMEDCQKRLSKIISQLLQLSIFPIAIGGGHDIAYGHFMGIWDALKKTKKQKIGIINFDAHFDLRPVEEKSNSGTPFNQILSKFNKSVDYIAVGIQQQSNTKLLFDIAHNKNVSYITSDYCNLLNINSILHQLDTFVEKQDWLYITIDMDGFSSVYAPGVSAPSPLGFSPNFIFKILRYLLDTKKTIACDIAELNPNFDVDNTTANLAARLVDFIVTNY